MYKYRKHALVYSIPIYYSRDSNSYTYTKNIRMHFFMTTYCFIHKGHLKKISKL